MDEKMHSSEVEFPRTGRLTKWLIGAVVVLSLVVGVVSTLVGVAYFTSSSNCGASKKASVPDVSGTVTITSPDGHGTQTEHMEYSVEENVAIYVDGDGLFSAMDYGKGLEIFNSPDAKDVCYLVPTEVGSATPKDNREFFSSQITSRNVMNETTIEEPTRRVLEGELKDTSFLPTFAQNRCDSTFWLVELTKADEQEHHIEKRSCYYRYRYFYHCYPNYHYHYHYYRYNRCYWRHIPYRSCYY